MKCKEWSSPSFCPTGEHGGWIQQPADLSPADEPADQGLLPLLPVPAQPALSVLGPRGAGGPLYQLLLCCSELL